MVTAAFDPGPGWREAEKHTPMPSGGLIEFGEHGQVLRTWVREVPAPPLPTAPNTVIRVEWRNGTEGPLVLLGSLWWNPLDSGQAFEPDVLPSRIQDFEVLAVPVDHGAYGRGYAAGAKAALDRVLEEQGTMDQSVYDDIAREFGGV